MIKRKMGNKILTIVGGTTILLTSIVLALGIPEAYAQSHYQTGYNDGCAGNVVPGPHTSDYKRGYADGQAACSGGGSGSSSGGSSDGSGGSDNNTPQPLQSNPGPSPSSDWTLTVNINNVNFGESSINVSVKGPFGYSDNQDVPNGPSPAASFTIPGSAIPAGYRFEVCAGTGLGGALLPRCTFFAHAQDGDQSVTVTP
jgi:hypothetical protein